MIKSILFILCVFLGTHAAVYHLAATGNDSATPQQAGSVATPWKSINRLNLISLVAGDSVLFNRADTFYGAIVAKTSGAVGNPIYYGAYGTGAKPVITGAVTITGWTSLGGGLYSAHLTQAPKMLLYDNEPLMLARSPNKGYRKIYSVQDSVNFTDSSAIGDPDWTGATLHIRTSNWTLHVARGVAFNPSTGKFTLKAKLGYPVVSGWGYFINCSRAALDTAGEWFYDSLGQTLFMRSPQNGDPNNHRITGSVLGYGLWAKTGQSFYVEGIEFCQYAINCMELTGSNLTVSGCVARYAESYGIKIYSGSGNRVSNNLVYGCNGMGISVGCPSSIVERNTITAMALFGRLNAAGMNPGFAISCEGSDNITRLNRIDSVGWLGIQFNGVRSLVERNYIRHCCITGDDGGGIYGSNRNYPANQGIVGSTVRDNIVLYSVGAGAGTDHPNGSRAANGIYMDDHAHGVTLTGNTAAYCAGYGFQLHNTVSLLLTENKSFGNKVHQIWLQDNDSIQADSMQYNVITNNEFCSTSDLQKTFSLSSNRNRITLGTFDSNTYWNPYVSTPIYAKNRLYSLADWQTLSGQDKASKVSTVHWGAFSGTELITNSFFETNVTPWHTWPSTSTLTRDTNQGLDQGCLRVNCASVGTQTSLAISNSFPLKEGYPYVIRFSVRGTKTSTLIPIVRSAVNYAVRGYSTPVLIDTLRRNYTLRFTANSTEAACRLDFQNVLIDSVYWLDNISVQPDTVHKAVLLVNPTEKDTLLRLTNDMYFTDGFKAPQEITLRPFGSVILYRDSIVLSTALDTVADGEVGEEAVFSPNPFNPSINIRITGVKGRVSVDIFTINGRKIATLANREKSPAGKISLNWSASNYASGLYMVRVISENRTILRKITLLK